MIFTNNEGSEQMNSAELGKKIKEARLAKKMTQSEVVGDFITRNMLSQIESGVACPSIKTLQYLARMLEIPVKDLIPDESGNETQPVDDSIVAILLKAKDAFRAGNYALAIDITQPMSVESSPFHDESCAILAMSCLSLAKEKEQDGQLKDAAKWAEKAVEYADKGIYSGREVKTKALLMLDELAEKL